MADAAFEQDDYFKIDPELHMVGDIAPLNHFPGVQMWWRAIDNIKRPLLQGTPEGALDGIDPADLNKTPDPEDLLGAMDRFGVDIGCLLPESMMDTTGYSSRWVSNGDMAAAVEKHPDRFMYQPNISPIKQRGVDNAVWELEYWVKERDARLFKFYPPEDTYINDPDLWPFYRKAEELGIVLDIHTGFSWVPPGKSKHSLPILLDDVARDFPDLKIVAFHMGYPHCDDLNMVALGHPNVYPCLSLLVPWAISAPRKFARIIGEALRFVPARANHLGDRLRGLRRPDRGGGEGLPGVPDSRGHAGGVRLPRHHRRRPAHDLRGEPGEAARDRAQAEDRKALRLSREI